MSEEKQVHEIKVGGYDWPDFIVRTWLINSAVMGVEAFEVIGEGDRGPEMLQKGWKSSPQDSTENPDEAEVFVEGSIKWDGCADLNIGRDGYVHLCGRTTARKLGLLIDKLYDIATERLAHNIIDE